MNASRLTMSLAAAMTAVAVVTLPAQQPAITIDGDDVTIRGCVRKAGTHASTPGSTLVWSRSDIMLAAVTAGTDAPGAVGTAGLASRIFYWLEDDEDLTRHIGNLVEVKGDLEDFEVGEVKVERDGEFTEIEVDLDGKTETARIPTSWLQDAGIDKDKDKEFEIATRRIDVDEVRVIGPCR